MATKGKKGTCGETKMTSLTRLSHQNCFPIEFDERGNAIGPNKNAIPQLCRYVNSNYHMCFLISYLLIIYNN